MCNNYIVITMLQNISAGTNLYVNLTPNSFNSKIFPNNFQTLEKFLNFSPKGLKLVDISKFSKQ